MPTKFSPEYSELSNLRKELEPLRELALSAKKLAKSSESRSLSAEKLASSSEAIAKSSESQAESAKVRADIAVHTSKKADIKGWIAVIVSVIGLTIEIVVNFPEISAFISCLL